MAVDDNARALAEGCWRIKHDRLESDDFEHIRDELGLDEEEWQRLRLLLDRNRGEEDDESLLENWHTVKEEIIGGRIYGFVRGNFPEISHELLESAYFSDKPYVGRVPVDEENALAELPFTFRTDLTDNILFWLQAAGDRETLRRGIIRALRRARRRRRIIRPLIWALAYIGIALFVAALWKLLTVIL